MMAAMVLLGLCISVAVTEATGVTHLAAAIVRIAAGDGTLVVEVDDPQVSITIDGEELVITGAGPQEVRLKPGQYQVQASKGGRIVKQEPVTIERGGRQVLRVALEPSLTPPAMDAQRLDELSKSIRANEVLSPPGGWDYSSGMFDFLMQHEEVFAAIAARRPDDPHLWGWRGYYYTARGQWNRALPAFARASVQRPGFPWEFNYAFMLVLTGDEEGYRRLCAGMAERFGQTDEARWWLAFACSLAPRSGVDPARVVKWADLAVGARPKDALVALGFARYRAGQFQDAVSAFQEAMALPDPMPKCEAAFPLALAYRGLGQEKEAREWYQVGLTELNRLTPQDPDDPMQGAPATWMCMHVWYREAKAVFEPPQNPVKRVDDKDTKDTKKL